MDDWNHICIYGLVKEALNMSCWTCFVDLVLLSIFTLYFLLDEKDVALVSYNRFLTRWNRHRMNKKNYGELSAVFTSFYVRMIWSICVGIVCNKYTVKVMNNVMNRMGYFFKIRIKITFSYKFMYVAVWGSNINQVLALTMCIRIFIGNHLGIFGILNKNCSWLF